MSKQRPWVVYHMVASLDGKLRPKSKKKLPGDTLWLRYRVQG